MSLNRDLRALRAAARNLKKEVSRTLQNGSDVTLKSVMKKRRDEKITKRRLPRKHRFAVCCTRTVRPWTSVCTYMVARSLVYCTCMHFNCMAFKCVDLNAMHLWSTLHTSLEFNTSEVNGLELDIFQLNTLEQLYELHLCAPDSAVHVQSTRRHERKDNNIQRESRQPQASSAVALKSKSIAPFRKQQLSMHACRASGLMCDGTYAFVLQAGF